MLHLLTGSTGMFALDYGRQLVVAVLLLVLLSASDSVAGTLRALTVMAEPESSVTTLLMYVASGHEQPKISDLHFKVIL